jgi:putative tryptophan/tyrosine transport system substrate-binding protein
MKRRDFITLLGAAAAAPSMLWPYVARAQRPAMPVIGYLSAGAPDVNANAVSSFLEGLTETGFVEGRNVAVDYRWALNDLVRLPELAADLVRRQPAVIITPLSVAATLAAKVASTTIPIVFIVGGDPVQAGLVTSLNRPGGNVTGIASMNSEIAAKRLGLLLELVPRAARFAVLVNSNSPVAESVITDVRAGASAIGRQIEVFAASTGHDIDTAFARLVERRCDALLVSPDILFINRRVQLFTLAARRALPVIYATREDAEAGGLMSYGSSLADLNRQAGIYAGRILKGEKPADLPVLRATKFELVINLQSAKATGIEVPSSLLAIADEVIE